MYIYVHVYVSVHIRVPLYMCTGHARSWDAGLLSPSCRTRLTWTPRAIEYGSFNKSCWNSDYSWGVYRELPDFGIVMKGMFFTLDMILSVSRMGFQPGTFLCFGALGISGLLRAGLEPHHMSH